MKPRAISRKNQPKAIIQINIIETKNLIFNIKQTPIQMNKIRSHSSSYENAFFENEMSNGVKTNFKKKNAFFLNCA